MAPKTNKPPNRKLPNVRQFSPAQAAPFLGVTRRRVIAMIENGSILADLVGGEMWVIPRSEVEREVARRRLLNETKTTP